MYLGRVIGTVVASRIVEGMEGHKLLLVQPLDHAQRPTGEPVVAVDVVRAGPGELVTSFGGHDATFRDLEIAGVFDEYGFAWTDGTLVAQLDTRELAAVVLRAKGLDDGDAVMRKAVTYAIVQLMRKREMSGQVRAVGTRNRALLWRLPNCRMLD